MGTMRLERGELVGDQIGDCLDVDLDRDGNAMGLYMRIKVKMDITVPIMRFITIELDEEQDEEHDQISEELMGAEDMKEKKICKKIVSFEYEHLPDFCYNCGIIGHTERACPSRTRRESDQQFGPWLRANMYSGSSSDERSKISSDRGDFWNTYSAGSKGSKQGSDRTSWRKSLPEAGMNEDKLGIRGEEKEVTRPLKKTQDDTHVAVKGRELVFEENKQLEKTMDKSLEPSPCKQTVHPVDPGVGIHEKEMAKVSTTSMKITQGEKERGQRREDEHNKERIKEIRSGTSLKLGTFKRRERDKEKQQQNQSPETVLKKRNADMMEVDLEVMVRLLCKGKRKETHD